MSTDIPHVVYHIAAMGDWNMVIGEQFLALRLCGLAQKLREIGDAVNITYVGPLEDIYWVHEEAARHDIPIRIVRSDAQILHYETFAILEVERLAKVEKTDRPILYFHTKGVSNLGDKTKPKWRKVMQKFVIDRWKENVELLKSGHDAAGWNWWYWRGNDNHGNMRQHFSGNFWMATPDLIRRLPSYVEFHHAHNLVRFSCELWIGSSGDCKPFSYAVSDEVTWDNNYNYDPFLDPVDVTVTWITGATPRYQNRLSELTRSFGNLGPQHRLLSVMVPEGEWKNNGYKLKMIDSLLPAIKTPYVFWVDADCYFLCQLHHTDLVHPDFEMSCLNHFGYDRPEDGIPDRLRHLVPHGASGYHQTCLFGGTVDAMKKTIDRVSWIHDDSRGYDEHALNIDWWQNPVFTLPCRYGAPDSFSRFESYKSGYERKAGGAPRILHFNSEITGK